MKIAIFCNDFWPTIGGVQTGVWGLSRALQRRGHATVVLTCQPAGTAIEEVVDGIEVRRFRWNLRPIATFPLRALRAKGAVQGALDVWRPDVVLAHFVSVHAVYARACAQVLGVPLILSFRGNDALRIAVRSGVHRYAYQWLVSAADASLFCSSWLRDQTMKATWFQAVAGVTGVLADAVEVGHRESLQVTTGSYVIAAGRLVYKKGFDILLRAWHTVAEQIGVPLWIAGDGPEERSLKELAAREALGGSVQFLGAVPHARLLGLLERSALCIVPSREEPYGIVVVEAQALGVPVLACAVGNIPCLIDHRDTGYLSPPTVEGLEQGLLEAWGDPSRKEVGTAGQSTPGATRSYDVMAQELEDWVARARKPNGRQHGWT